MELNESLSKQNRFMPMIIIGILFFIFGFVTWLNGSLIPFLKIACELSDMQAMLVTFSFYIAYFIMAMPASKVLHKTGYKKGISLGLFVMAVGTIIFIPAAYSRSYILFLTGLFVQGTGLAILQTASNPFIIIIGPAESAAKRIAIMGICNKIAGVISPLILSAIILAGANELSSQLELASGADKTLILDALARRIITPYIVMCIVLVILAVGVFYSQLPNIDTDDEEPINADNTEKEKSWWQYIHLWIGFIALFAYVGAEVIAGDTISLFGQSLGIELDKAKNFTSLTLSGMVIGYIVGIIAIPKYLKQEKALQISAILGIVFTFFALFTNGMTSVYFIALLGFANAMMWPTIFPLAVADLGKFTKEGSALLIMGIAGGALLPLLWAKISQIFTPHQAYWLLIPLYIIILFFATYGYKIRNKKTK